VHTHLALDRPGASLAPGVSMREAPVRRRAAPVGRELYHVVHPSDEMADLWTADQVLAWSLYERFVQKYGGAHLHFETLYAGQYDAECLLCSGVEAPQ
jgi:hypothetical protein